jgi:hypothetical protein
MLQTPAAHGGFLQGLESVTEYKTFKPDGRPGKKYRRSKDPNIEECTLDWAVRAVVQQYNDESCRLDEPPLELRDLTR